jgi:hypothetical protein
VEIKRIGEKMNGKCDSVGTYRKKESKKRMFALISKRWTL